MSKDVTYNTLYDSQISLGVEFPLNVFQIYSHIT